MSNNLRLPHDEVPTRFPWLALKVMAAAPAAPFLGQMALADGDNWDPLSAVGPYLVVYSGTAWVSVVGAGD